MRILVISNYFPPLEIGGWGQITRDVCAGLGQRGHRVHVLASRHRVHEITEREEGIERTLHQESPDHVHYHPHYSLLHPLWQARNRRITTQAIDAFQPDVIYVNGMWNLPHDVARTAERLCPGRVVYYMASTWPTEMDAHTGYWQEESASPGRRLLKRTLGTVVQKTLLSRVPRNRLDFALVLCVSEFIRQHMIEAAGIPEERTRVVHNGVEIDAFSMSNGARKAGPLRLLYAGRLTTDKGVHTVIESLGHLKEHGLQRSFSLSIFGSGSPAYEARLRRQARQLAVEELIHFQTFVPREQMPAVFARHDVLLFPSVWEEPLARVVQEGMACGLVVIGTTTGGTPEILCDGENGLTFEAENAQMLAEKIVQVVDDAALRQRLAQAGRKTVEARFTLERMVDEVEESLASVR